MANSHYDEQLRRGAAEYQDALDVLSHAGFPCAFTQTGGMNAAIEVRLERGWLLVTDVDDALPWSREFLRGWGVGYYQDHSWCEGPSAFVDSDSPAAEVLPGLVKQCLVDVGR